MDDTPTTAEAIRLLANLGRDAADPHIQRVDTKGLGDGLPKEVPLAFDRQSQHFLPLGAAIETYRQAPQRRTGVAQADTLASFIDLVNRHKTKDSVLFGKAGWPDPKLRAVIDYHGVDHSPAWMDHCIDYAFPLTDEFKAWVAMNGKAMEQAEFAVFLEDHAAELAAPQDGEKSEFERLFRERFATPSELLTLSRELEVFVGAKAKRGVRLQSGERTVEFITEHTDAKGQRVDIPGIFIVSVPAFVDGDAVRIPARLRYRIGQGAISWFYQLYRWEFWLRVQVQQSLKEASDKTELPAFEGRAEQRG